MLTKSILLRNLMYSRRGFSVLPKNPKVELTVRTPYRTLFDKFNQFTRIYVNTLKGTISIGNKTIPRIYLLPPGELTVKGLSPGTPPRSPAPPPNAPRAFLCSALRR